MRELWRRHRAGWGAADSGSRCDDCVLAVLLSDREPYTPPFAFGFVRGSVMLVWLLFTAVFVGAPEVGGESSEPPTVAQHDHGHDHGAAGHTDQPTPETDDAVATGRKPAVLWLLLAYSVLIVASSLFGGWLPSRIRLTHTRMQMMMSLVGGLMLGIGLFHLLPHGLHELGPAGIDRGVWWMVVGIVTMFLLIRTFHFHSHDVPHESGEGHAHDHDGHDDCQHGHHHHGGDVHRLSWMGVFIGLSLHTLIDGLALGASIQADAAHSAGWGLFGLGTFLAIALHKPLDAVSITMLMQASGWSSGSRRLANVTFSLMCPIGALLFVFGLSRLGANQSIATGCALTFSAGIFLCISLGDLLPEMEFHSHNRVQLTSLLLAGLALAWAIGFLEPEHAHSHSAVSAPAHSHD